MIRLNQRRLIIPRGDTGSFTVPVLASNNTGDVAVFSIFDTLTKKKVFEKVVEVSGETINIEFSHGDTVNLPVGKYVWDIKFYQSPIFADGVLVDGTEIDSYYAAFTLPICEIRQTGDLLLTADDAPTTTVEPESLNIVEAAIAEANAAKQVSTNNADAAAQSATAAAASAEAASISAASASNTAQYAATTQTALETIAAQVTADKAIIVDAKDTTVSNATSASTNATNAANSATAASNSATTASNAATTATNKAADAAASATAAAGSVTSAKNYADEAAMWAADAQGSASDASGLAYNASQSAEAAAASASTATNKATAADNSATSAANSATAASGSATSASGSATIATNKAAEASASATSASNSATSALASAQSATSDANRAVAAANEIKSISVEATDLNPHSSATATYNSTTGKFTFGIPQANSISSIVMNNDYTLTITYTDGTTFNTVPLKGEQGDAFHIVKTYASIAAMNADYSGTDVEVGEFVMIVSNVEDPDNAKVYVKGDQAYNFIIDMSGASGINGVGIASITKTDTSNNIDTYTITYTNNNTSTFTVRNGIDGDEYTVLVQSEEPTEPTNKLWILPPGGLVQEVPTVQEMNTAIAAAVPVEAGSGIGSVQTKSFTVNNVEYSNTASGQGAFAEGSSTLASGTNAHAEGYYTIAAGQYEHAQGVYNKEAIIYSSWVKNTSYNIGDRVSWYNRVYECIEANNDASFTQSKWKVLWFGTSDRAFVIGNGTGPAEAKRSNAAAIDWSGDAHFAGNVYVGANADSSGGTMLPRDVQVNGTSVVSNGVANIPVASSSTFGAIKVGSGLFVSGASQLITDPASQGQIKAGIDSFRPMTPTNAHSATFYGLAKAAGADMASISETTVGVYPAAQKAAICAMIGADTSVTEVVSGTTPVVTGQSNHRYLCGEVAILDFTPSASGVCDIVFTSGSTATVLTLPSTVKMPDWFDATQLDANTIYEISIADGIYGAVMSWAS